MLKKRNRINLNKDFDKVFKNKLSFYNDIFGLKLAKNNLNEFRLGILIGTKVSKKAVVRNKIKRQIREIVRREIPLFKEGQDLVVVVLPPILHKTFIEIKEQLLIGTKQLKMYKNTPRKT